MDKHTPPPPPATTTFFGGRRIGRWVASPLFIFALALVARLAWVLTLPNELIWIDEKEFAEIGRHIAAGDGYISTSYRANPVVPTYLAAFFRLFGDSVLYPRIGQSVVGALACVLVQRIGAVVAGGAVGTVAALLVAVYPGHIYLSGVFYVDCIASFLLLAWILTAYRTTIVVRPLAAAAMSGLLFGLLALTRSTFLAIVPIAASFFFILPGARLASRLRIAAVFAIVCTLTIAPWTIRNYRHYGRVIVISTGFWDTLWKGNNELSDGGPDDRFLTWDGTIWRDRLARVSQSERDALVAKYADVHRRVRELRGRYEDEMLARDDVLKPIATELISQAPGRFVDLFVRKVITLFDAFTTTGVSNLHTTSPLTIVVRLYFYPLLALAVVGAALTARDWRRFAPLLLLIGAWVGVHGILTSCTRFRLSIDPILFLFSAIALVRLTGGRYRRSG